MTDEVTTSPPGATIAAQGTITAISHAGGGAIIIAPAIGGHGAASSSALFGFARDETAPLPVTSSLRFAVSYWTPCSRPIHRLPDACRMGTFAGTRVRFRLWASSR
jgi:hypothetical protein